MSQAERIEETLGWLKIVFGALVAWLAQNFRTAEAIMVVLAVVAGSAFYILVRGYIRRLDS